MTPERWARLQAAFHRVVESAPPERDATLRLACGDDLELRREVEAMLESDAEGDQRLRAAIDGAATKVVEHKRASLIGTFLGAYRVTGVLGHGGMGTVYLAERADRQFQQRVAIKLVEQMAVHPQLRTRLRAERQILANLEHPYIAHLVDGGENEAGIPFLVIEYIDGLPIDEYCGLASSHSRSAGVVRKGVRCGRLCAPQSRRAPGPEAGQHPGHCGRHP